MEDTNCQINKQSRMASIKAHHFLLLLIAILLLASPVYSDDEEEDLLKNLNSHRAYLDLPTFMKNKGASCVADEVAKTLKKQPCDNTNPKFQLNQDPHLLSKCHINVTHAKHSVILPVCVPRLDPIEVFTNYTKSSFAKYIKNVHYEQVGISSHRDWMVVVLGTSTAEGDFSSSAANGLVPIVGFGYCLVSFFLGVFMFYSV